MAVNQKPMSAQVKALKTTDLSPFIRMSNVFVPRLLSGFLVKLDEKQRKAFDKVLPVGGEKKIFVHLTDTPTPPIVFGMAQPPIMSTQSEKEVKKQKIKGIKLTTNEIQLLQEGQTPGNMLRLLWSLKRQLLTILGIMMLFLPFLLLGPSEIRDLRSKVASHFKPLTDLMPRTPKVTYQEHIRAGVY